jgi:hypothetical protein
MVNNLVFLDRKRVKENFLNRLDLTILYKTTKLGNRDPFFLVTSSTATSTTTTATTSTSTVTSVIY